MATRFRLTPYGRLCASMAVLILIGWGLLMLPLMSAVHPATWLESLFTSTSAICVTGLIVRSTGHDWSFLGQVVILLLIQVGGLGFMTLSSSALMHLRRKATLDEMLLIRESLGRYEGDDVGALLKRCLRIVLWVEGIGAVLLFTRFVWEYPTGGEWAWLRHLPQAAWAAVFHSVSAFCNAGFSIWDSSLMEYADDVWVNGVMSALIILGGLGFFVLADLEAWLRARRERKTHQFRFQTRLVLVTSGVLLVAGTLLIWLSNDKVSLLVAGFQSVTARTAGFNTIKMTDLSIPSVGVLMILMFIGASPGSCGGGIKTTTAAVLMLLSTAAFRSGKEPGFRNRTFSRITIGSAIAVFFAAVLLVVSGSVFLLLAETGAVTLETARGEFAALIFEAVSAFGTVGLSTGITPELKMASKLCLVALMFLGRVGPLGLISVSLRRGVRPLIRYPEEDVQIG